jgi:Polyketide synthase modules and related proteins
MFSGQGSQYYQMGKTLFDSITCFRNYMIHLDEIIYSMSGIRVLEVVFDGSKQKTEQFSNVLYTHPAIFMVEYSLAKLLMEEGIKPDFVLGTSMGEFSSAVLAGVIELKDALRIIIKQAEAFKAYCQKGGMLAVLSDRELYFKTPSLYQNSEIVSVNFKSHFVISAGIDEIRMAEEFLRQSNAAYFRLPVDHGFHSHSIDSAEYSCLKELNSCVFKHAEIPMISCLDGNIINKISKTYLWDVVRKPIEFAKAIGMMEQLGSYEYLDLGPSGTLANFVKYNLTIESQSRHTSIITPYSDELQNLDKARRMLCN